MPLKIADHSVVVGALTGRNDASYVVPPNTSFNFTDAEIKDILRARPDSLRDPVDETKPAPVKGASRKGGKAALAAPAPAAPEGGEPL